MTPARGFRIALMLVGALALSGCISLFPKGKPAQLYRFDGAVPAARASAPATGPRVGVLKFPTTFPREAGLDRILTVEGAKTAYIAESRWVAPAPVLFDEAVSKAFDADNGAARVVGRGEAGRAQLTLRLDMRAFEADYMDGPDAAPTILVRLRATMVRTSDRSLAGDKMFEAKIGASDNRVHAIVEAFNQAIGAVISDLVTWTDEVAASTPAA